MSASSTNAKLVLIWDSVIANFDNSNDILENIFLSFRTLNFGISGNKIQNVVWRVCTMSLPTSGEYIIIYCGNNNLGHNSPLKIAEGLINLACMLKKKL